MLDVVIRNSLDIVARTERLIEKARRLIATGRLDDVEAYRIHTELERLTDLVFIMDDAARLLRRMFELRPEMARACTAHPTLQ
jgi:hypothetical protein